MASEFALYDLPFDGPGKIAICPMPGLGGTFERDLIVLCRTGVTTLVSMTPVEELEAAGVADLPERLAEAEIEWRHCPVSDFGIPEGNAQLAWSRLSPHLQKSLDQSGFVAFHCRGGCGRSGMAALRLAVERGNDPAEALRNLRENRPCAVETTGQEIWASKIYIGDNYAKK